MIVVDWRNGTNTSNCFRSVGNTPIVGAMVANFMRKLMSLHQQRPDQFTMVGHSLGAHVCGFVGANFTESKIRAIYGLDPAGPAFVDISPQFRLDPSDANLVVTLTTNAGLTSVSGNGLSTPVGHYCFFINGGYMQPGCSGGSVFNLLFSASSFCSHQRASWLIQVSATDTQECHSMGYQCESYEAFLGGECGTCSDGSEQCQPLYSFFVYWNKQANIFCFNKIVAKQNLVMCGK